MKIVKFLSLGLLLANSIALANVNVEVAVTHDGMTQTDSAMVCADQSTAIFNDGVINVEAVVAKAENEVQLIITDASNEVIAAPVIKVLDGQEGVITLASDDNAIGVEIKVNKESVA